jgi:hypothetical protein
VYWWPVVRVGRTDEDAPVQAELLPVVLPDVRVVPVGARIRDLELVPERLADRNGLLRVVRPVVAVLEAQPVPVNGRLEVAVVRDVDGDGRTLGDRERRPGTEPLYESMRTVASPTRFVTGRISRSYEPPSASSTSSVGTASASPVTSWSNACVSLVTSSIAHHSRGIIAVPEIPGGDAR